jgi:histidyl-tRNA synthetase
MAYRGNMKKRLSRASDAGAAFAVILGDAELDSGEVQLKDLATGDQRNIAFDQVIEALRS